MSTEQKSESFSESSGEAPRRAAQTFHDLSDEAVSRLSAAAQGAEEQIRTSTSSLATQANDQLQDFLRAQIRAGSNLVHEAAEAARTFAESLDEKSPHVAELVRSAAGRTDDFSRATKNLEPVEMYEMAKDYAQRQPAAVLAAAIAVGFAAARFLRSSPPASGGRALTRAAGRGAAEAVEREDDA